MSVAYVIATQARMLAIIRFNIVFSSALKVAFLALTLLGDASLWLAILADTGATLIVVARRNRPAAPPDAARLRDLAVSLRSRVMNPDPLERKLEAYARQPMPDPPSNLSAGVWGEIERRRGSSGFGWSELLARPYLTLAALAFAIAMGVVPAFAFVKTQNAKRLASDSLHFDVFSTHAAGQVVGALSKSGQLGSDILIPGEEPSNSVELS